MSDKFALNNTRKTGQTVKLDNIELHYETLGSGPVLLLLHGYGGCTQNWHAFIHELSKQYKLLLVDLPGHGHSGILQYNFTHNEAATHVLQLLKKLGIETCMAMGMSTGSMVLMHMATQNPDCLRAMVLISVTTHFPEQARNIMRRASFQTMPADVVTMYKTCAKHGDVQIQKLIESFNALHNNYHDMNFSPQTLATIHAPTLLIHGENDHFFSTEIAENIHQALPNSELWVIAGGEHVPIYNCGAEFTNRAIRFLQNSAQKESD